MPSNKHMTSKQRRRQKLLELDGPCCYWCGIVTTTKPQQSNSATLEHIVPFSVCKSNDLKNLRLACYSCNNRRHTTEPNDFRLQLLWEGISHNPKRPHPEESILFWAQTNENTTMRMSSFTKLIVGVTGVGLIYYFLPILDLVELFLMIVLIPLVFLTSIGLIGESTYEAIQNWAPDIRKEIERLSNESNLSTTPKTADPARPVVN